MRLEDLVEYKTSKSVRSIDDLDSNKITFVMHKNGVLQFRKNQIGSFLVGADEEHLQYLPEVKTEFRFSLAKIPGEILGTVISFFKRVVNEKNGAEAMVQIFWDDTKHKYFIHCCEQDVSGASVTFKRDIKLEKEHILVADIHSHNTMDAFFSGTDNRDEKEDRLYGVCGKLNTKKVQVLFRAGCAGNYVNVKPEKVFSFIPTKTYEFPSNWMSKIKYIPIIEKTSRHADLDRAYGFGQYDLFGAPIYDDNSRCPWCGQSLKKKTRKGVDY